MPRILAPEEHIFLTWNDIHDLDGDKLFCLLTGIPQEELPTKTEELAELIRKNFRFEESPYSDDNLYEGFLTVYRISAT